MARQLSGRHNIKNLVANVGLLLAGSSFLGLGIQGFFLSDTPLAADILSVSAGMLFGGAFVVGILPDKNKGKSDNAQDKSSPKSTV